MTQIFQRSIYHGWLILSGSSPAIDERSLERLLSILDTDRPVFLLQSGVDIPPGIAQWIEDLAALLDIETQLYDLDALNPTEVGDLVGEAGMFIMVGSSAEPWLALGRNTLNPNLAQGEQAILWFVGPASLSLGEWMYDPSRNECSEALHWLPGCLLLQEEQGLVDLEPAQQLLRHHMRSYALNLVGGATIAMGPAGEIDLWGSPAPSITLGQGWGEN